MGSLSIIQLFVLGLLILPWSLAQNITASTCVSPSGFTQCYNQAVSHSESCLTSAGNDLDKAVACACTLQLNELNCAMTNCWNVVYGCEYQQLANLYDADCSAPVPFFPAPDNAPGGCSCNLGYVLYNNTNVEEQYKDCITTDVDQNAGCTCCQQAAGYAALYNICPSTATDPLFPDADEFFIAEDPNLQQDQCADYFASYDCSSLGYTGLGVPFMTSFDSATLGTQTISNTNTKTLTSPASGATFTWTDLGLEYTIVAVNADAKATGGSAGSSSKAGTSATAGTGSGSASSAGGAAQSTSSAKSEGHSRIVLTPARGVVVVLVFLLCNIP